jgi:hypothetical protein
MLFGKCGLTLGQGDLLMVKSVCWVYVPIPNQSTREILGNWNPLTGSGIEGELRRGERK